MNLKKTIFLYFLFALVYSCADYRTNGTIQKKEKHYFSSSGFALIYEEDLYKQKVINRKINNEHIRVMHSLLKVNTPVKIINPDNLKVVETKIYKKANYPKIFNVVVSKKIASILELDINNPYVEIIEIKKNKTFVAKKGSITEEEKNVAEKIPVDEVKMDDLTKNEPKAKKEEIKESNYILLINDFFYEDSAVNLKNELIKKPKWIISLLKKLIIKNIGF